MTPDWRVVVLEMQDRRNAEICAALGVTDRTVNRYRKALGVPGGRGKPEDELVHGTEHGHRRGCDCEPCAVGHREFVRTHQVSRFARGLAPDDKRHGTENGYRNWGCKCAPCRAANAAKSARQRQHAG